MEGLSALRPEPHGPRHAPRRLGASNSLQTRCVPFHERSFKHEDATGAPPLPLRGSPCVSDARSKPFPVRPGFSTTAQKDDPARPEAMSKPRRSPGLRRRAHGATNKEHHVCARRRAGEAAGSSSREQSWAPFSAVESKGWCNPIGRRASRAEAVGRAANGP